MCGAVFPVLPFERRVVCLALLWVVLSSPFSAWVVLPSLPSSFPQGGCYFRSFFWVVLLSLPPSGGVVFLLLLCCFERSTSHSPPPMWRFSSSVVLFCVLLLRLLWSGGGFTPSLIFGGAAGPPPPLGRCGLQSSYFVVGGVAFFLFLWVVFRDELAFGSSWGLTIVEGQGRCEVRTRSLWCRWFLGCSFFCYWCYAFVQLWFWGLGVVFDICDVASLLGDAAFPLVLLCGVVCLLVSPSGTAFSLPLLLGSAPLVGVAVPSSSGVVLLAPLRWCCFLFLSAFWRCCFVWCCFLFLSAFWQCSVGWCCCPILLWCGVACPSWVVLLSPPLCFLAVLLCVVLLSPLGCCSFFLLLGDGAALLILRLGVLLRSSPAAWWCCLPPPRPMRGVALSSHVF